MAWAPNSRRRKQLPPDWQKIRTRILRRDSHTCVACGLPANQVDHIDPQGPHEDWNLRSLCQTCHMRRTQAQAVESRKRNYGKKRTHRPVRKHPGLL